MSRYIYQGTTKDGTGKVVCEATISVYLAGGYTVASVYTAMTGGVAVNSVTSGAIESSNPGYFGFWVDTVDYSLDQRFRIVISKAGFNPQIYDYVFAAINMADVTGLPGLLADDQHVLDSEVLAIAASKTVSATDKVLGRASAGAGNVEEIACTAAGRALIDDADAAAQRTTLGLGTIATENYPLHPQRGGLGTDIYVGYTKATLPTPTVNRRIVRVTDNIRGLWMEQGTQWFGLNGEVVNGKEFGLKIDGVTNDTSAFVDIINTMNAIAGLNKPTLYLPAGICLVYSNTLPDIKFNVYGPDCTIRGLAPSADTYHLLSVDYSSTIGQTFVLRALQGSEYPSGIPRNCGLQIKGADNSVFRINQLELLDTGISLAGNLLPGHIAQNTFYIQTCMTVNKGFNLTSGTGIQVEANTFHIEYLRPGVANAIGVYLSNVNNYTSNNIFKINVMELHVTAGEVGFYLTGTTPGSVLQNVFEVAGNLTAPSGAGKIVHCDAGIGVNLFNLCRQDYLAQITFSSKQLFNCGIADWNYSRSILFGTTPPTAGYWDVGTVMWNIGSATPNGWKCTVAPGTWTAF